MVRQKLADLALSAPYLPSLAARVSFFFKLMDTLFFVVWYCRITGLYSLIYGFLTRVDVNNALMGQEPGTFLLRFSERHSGQFGIAYVAMEPPHKIKHYLVSGFF